MASDAVSQRHAFDTERRHGGSENRRDEFWAALIGIVDGRLRGYYGIEEFTSDDRCILRIAILRAPARAVLSDGTVVDTETPIGALHLWNEHLPRYSKRGPDLRWACTVRRLFLHSMRLLAAHAERDPELQQVRAYRADAMLASRLGFAQLDRLAKRHGFDAVPAPFSALGVLHMLGASLNVWCLTRAFNPKALPRQRWRRERNALWISREELIERYGRESTASRRGAARAVHEDRPAPG